MTSAAYILLQTVSGATRTNESDEKEEADEGVSAINRGTHDADDQIPN